MKHYISWKKIFFGFACNGSTTEKQAKSKSQPIYTRYVNICMKKSFHVSLYYNHENRRRGKNNDNWKDTKKSLSTLFCITQSFSHQTKKKNEELCGSEDCVNFCSTIFMNEKTWRQRMITPLHKWMLFSFCRWIFLLFLFHCMLSLCWLLLLYFYVPNVIIQCKRVDSNHCNIQFIFIYFYFLHFSFSCICCSCSSSFPFFPLSRRS